MFPAYILLPVLWIIRFRFRRFLSYHIYYGLFILRRRWFIFCCTRMRILMHLPGHWLLVWHFFWLYLPFIQMDWTCVRWRLKGTIFSSDWCSLFIRTIRRPMYCQVFMYTIHLLPLWQSKEASLPGNKKAGHGALVFWRFWLF